MHSSTNRMYNIILWIWGVLGAILLVITLSIYFNIGFGIPTGLLWLLVVYTVQKKELIIKHIHPVLFLIFVPFSIYIGYRFNLFCILSKDKGVFMHVISYICGSMLALYISFIPLLYVSFSLKRIGKNLSVFLKDFSIIISIPLLLFIYLPTVNMLSNSDDYNLSYWQFILPNVVFFIIIVFTMTIVLFSLNQKIRQILVSLMFIASVQMFIQSLFLNKNIGIIDGYIFKASDHLKESIINSVICLLIAVGLLILLVFKSSVFNKISTSISNIFIVYQIIIILISMINAPRFAFKMTNYCLLGDEQFVVSRDKNVIVLMFDSLDSTFADEIYNNENYIYDDFNDFTMYTNACCVFDMTMDSLPQIMTGATYDNKTVDYQAFYDRLHENNYVINFYNYESLNGSIPVEVNFDNYTQNSYENIRYKIDYDSVLYNSVRLSAFQALPYVFKGSVNSENIDFNSQILYKGNNQKAIYDNYEFEDNMSLQLSESDKNYIIFQHLDGIHFPKDDYYEAQKDCMEIASEYIEKLKEAGLYDDATIIIMADHGLSDHKPPLTYPTASLPLFMIKCAGESHDDMILNSAPIYYTDMLKTILVCCNLYYPEDGDRFGLSIFDIAPDDKRERVWCNSGSGDRYNKEHYVYAFTGDIDDLSDKVKSEKYITIDY